MKLTHLSIMLLIFAASTIASAEAALYNNGFEADTAGWTAFSPGFHPTRVASGTNGITSASGDFHAVSSAGGSAGNWGGYNFGAGNAIPTAFQEYITAIDIFLNVEGGFNNDTRFDFSSAINNSAGTFMRDFIFNAGFYNDADGSPGSGTNRFVISASNNSQPGSAYAKNPGRDPVAISSSGWYTFQHRFYDSGGFLAADLSILDSVDQVVNTWTLTTTDPISSVGGNRYGWFNYNQLPVLAFDNSSLSLAAIPEASTAVFGLVVLGCCARRVRIKEADSAKPGV